MRFYRLEASGRGNALRLWAKRSKNGLLPTTLVCKVKAFCPSRCMAANPRQKAIPPRRVKRHGAGGGLRVNQNVSPMRGTAKSLPAKSGRAQRGGMWGRAWPPGFAKAYPARMCWFLAAFLPKKPRRWADAALHRQNFYKTSAKCDCIANQPMLYWLSEFFAEAMV